ncbi:MAG: RNA polymerase sigma factor [Polyangiaceae bacterium]
MPTSALSADRPQGPPAEADLVRRLKAGSPDAIAEAYDLHHEHLRAFARRFVGDPTAAEDLVHEVFVSLPSAITRFQGASSIRTFLVAIAVNHARHHLRAAARRRAAMERLSLEPPRPPGADPEQGTERARLAEALVRALDTLPIDQRAAFVLCEVEERSSQEVAAIVGAPEATVRTRVYHARQKLRKELSRGGFR